MLDSASVDQVVEICGCTPEQARGALDKSNWVLEDAIQRLLK